MERHDGTLQDRLVKEMRLAGVNDDDDIAAAHEFLEKRFRPPYNRRFMVKAARGADLHGPVGKRLAAGVRLDEVRCCPEPRVVLNDGCVPWRNRTFQLDKRHEGLGLAGRQVMGREKLDRVGAAAGRRPKAVLDGTAEAAGAGGGQEEGHREQPAMGAAA